MLSRGSYQFADHRDNLEWGASPISANLTGRFAWGAGDCKGRKGASPSSAPLSSPSRFQGRQCEVTKAVHKTAQLNVSMPGDSGNTKCLLFVSTE
jgi:hypothetical protein